MAPLTVRCRFTHRSGFRVRADFAVSPGVTALVGPSGSGKTTTLSLIAGLLRPHEGRITLGERILADVTRRAFVPPHRRGVGLVFQDGLLFPHLSVRRNLLYGRRWRRPGNGHVTPDRVIDILELGGLMDRAPRTLSGGESRRVALGRALLSSPDCLLLDEPLSGLDPPLQRQVVDFLGRVFEEYPVPTLLVSHDPAPVACLAARVIEVRPGEVVAVSQTNRATD